MKRIEFRTMLWLLLASATLLGAACKPGDDAPDADRALIETPAVGDVYAAELSAFSAATFGEADDIRDKAYGLMKVVAVDAAKVVVVTEDAASDEPRTARRESGATCRTSASTTRNVSTSCTASCARPTRPARSTKCGAEPRRAGIDQA